MGRQWRSSGKLALVLPGFLSLLSLPSIAAAGLLLIPVVASDFDDRDTTDPLDPSTYAMSSPTPVRIDQPAPEPPPEAKSESELDKATIEPSPDDLVPEPPDDVQQAKRKPLDEVIRVVTGEASWYGPGFYGNRTASGEVYRRGTMTAAHRSLPFGTKVRVTNLWNGRSVVIRINDRGPFVDHRILDLGHGAANTLGLTSSGTANVRMEVLR